MISKNESEIAEATAKLEAIRTRSTDLQNKIANKETELATARAQAASFESIAQESQIESMKWYRIAAKNIDVFKRSFDPITQSEIINYQTAKIPKAVRNFRNLVRESVTSSHVIVGDFEVTVGNFREAVTWYQLAANVGNTEAQLKLADLYYRGNGVLQDFGLALMWVNISCTLGFENAKMARYTWNQEGHEYYPKSKAEAILAQIYEYKSN